MPTLRQAADGAGNPPAAAEIASKQEPTEFKMEGHPRRLDHHGPILQFDTVGPATP